MINVDISLLGYIIWMLTLPEISLFGSSNVQSNRMQNLPYDAYKLLAVPAPIGGVLVFCANSLHYHSQVWLFYP